MKAEINWELNYISNLSFLSFEIGNRIFIEDLMSFIDDLLYKEGFRKIRLNCLEYNPKRKTIERMIAHFDGKQIGQYKEEREVSGRMNDLFLYEIYRKEKE